MVRYLCTQSSGGGGSYIRTTLNDTATTLPQDYEIILSDDFDNYDELQFYLCIYDGDVIYNHFVVISVPKDVLLKSYTDYNDSSISYQYKGRFEVSNMLIAGSVYGCTWQLIAKDKNKILSASKSSNGWYNGQCYIYKVVGVNYG